MDTVSEGNVDQSNHSKRVFRSVNKTDMDSPRPDSGDTTDNKFANKTHERVTKPTTDVVNGDNDRENNVSTSASKSGVGTGLYLLIVMAVIFCAFVVAGLVWYSVVFSVP